MGENTSWQIGRAQDDAVIQPTEIAGLTGDMIQVLAWQDIGVALNREGQVFEWGREKFSRNGRTLSILENSEKIVKVALGNYHVVALTSEGRLFVWGFIITPVPKLWPVSTIDLHGHKTSPEGGKKMLDIVAGGEHFLALTDKGEIYSWGRNDSGQLGDLSDTEGSYHHLPQKVQGKLKKAISRLRVGMILRWHLIRR